MSIRTAGNTFTRAKGLLWGSDAEDILVLVPCDDIHSCFMRQPIDIAFVGPDGKVLKSVSSFPPWKRMKVRGSAFVLERFSNTSPWLSEGDQLFAIPQLSKGSPREDMSNLPDSSI